MAGEGSSVRPERPLLSSDAISDLLSELAEAPDFATASRFLLAQFSKLLRSKRGLLLTIDTARRRILVSAELGLERGEAARAELSLEDEDHPLVVSALAIEPVVCDGAALERLEVPFDCWVALPLPQPQHRDAPPVRKEPGWAFTGRFSRCSIVEPLERERRRVGFSPFALAVVEGQPDSGEVAGLARAAGIAGPMLARLFAVEELHRSAVRLGQQSDLLNAIIDALPDPIAITDRANNFIEQNQRAELLFAQRDDVSEGRRRAVEINNMLFSSLLSKLAITDATTDVPRDLGLVDPIEGADLLFEVLSRPLPQRIAPEGSRLSVLRDVTDLKRVTIQLEQQYKRLRVTEMEATRERDRLNLILQNVGDPILVTDERTNIIHMNPRAAELFALPDEKQRDHEVAQRVSRNDTTFTALISDFVTEPEQVRRAQIRLLHPLTGAELNSEVIAGKILNERGEPHVIVSVIHDLTKQAENERLYEELKRFSSELEERIQLATKDLEERNTRLQWQSEELEKAYRLKSEFLANVSHELRTPINALIGYTVLMLDRIYGDLTPRQEEGLRRIHSASQHLLELINEILDLAKIEAGKMPINLEPVALRTVIAEVTAHVEPMVKKKGLDWQVDIAPDVPQMLTDRTKVKQVVLNLVSNAIKFTNQGLVRIEARPAGDSVEISVRDTGIGIRPEDLELIFEEFRQVDQSRTREFGGTGLGLSITRKLISLLGGQISVTSEYGKGTTFFVTLPVRAEPLTPEEQVARVALTGSRPPR